MLKEFFVSTFNQFSHQDVDAAQSSTVHNFTRYRHLSVSPAMWYLLQHQQMLSKEGWTNTATH